MANDWIYAALSEHIYRRAEDDQALNLADLGISNQLSGSQLGLGAEFSEHNKYFYNDSGIEAMVVLSGTELIVVFRGTDTAVDTEEAMAIAAAAAFGAGAGGFPGGVAAATTVAENYFGGNNINEQDWAANVLLGFGLGHAQQVGRVEPGERREIPAVSFLPDATAANPQSVY